MFVLVNFKTLIRFSLLNEDGLTSFQSVNGMAGKWISGL